MTEVLSKDACSYVPGGGSSIIGGSTQGHVQTPTVTITPKTDPSHKMKAVAWYGTKDVRVDEIPVPKITDPVSFQC